MRCHLYGRGASFGTTMVNENHTCGKIGDEDQLGRMVEKRMHFLGGQYLVQIH